MTYWVKINKVTIVVADENTFSLLKNTKKSFFYIHSKSKSANRLPLLLEKRCKSLMHIESDFHLTMLY